jgi:hypothetical protein
MRKERIYFTSLKMKELRISALERISRSSHGESTQPRGRN